MSFSPIKDEIVYNYVTIDVDFPQKSKWALEPPT